MLHYYYNRLVRHVLRREMVYRDRLNPFDRYDYWDGDSGLVKVLLVDLLEDSVCSVAQNAISAFPLYYICDSLDVFSLRSVQFSHPHANTILSMLFLFARYNSVIPMLMLFSRCFFSSLGTIQSSPC